MPGRSNGSNSVVSAEIFRGRETPTFNHLLDAPDRSGREIAFDFWRQPHVPSLAFCPTILFFEVVLYVNDVLAVEEVVHDVVDGRAFPRVTNSKEQPKYLPFFERFGRWRAADGMEHSPARGTKPLFHVFDPSLMRAYSFEGGACASGLPSVPREGNHSRESRRLLRRWQSFASEHGRFPVARAVR